MLDLPGRQIKQSNQLSLPNQETKNNKFDPRPTPESKVCVRETSLNLFNEVREMFKMNCLLPYILISMWGTIKTNINLSRFIQGLHNGVLMYMLD